MDFFLFCLSSILLSNQIEFIIKKECEAKHPSENPRLKSPLNLFSIKKCHKRQKLNKSAPCQLCAQLITTCQGTTPGKEHQHKYPNMCVSLFCVWLDDT